MKKNLSVPVKETAYVALGELAVSLITVGAFFLLDLFIKDLFDYTVITGVALGSIVIILNFFFMSYAVNRAIDEALTFRGDYVDEPAAEPALEAAPTEAQDADGGESEEDDGEDEPIVEDAAMRFARDHGARVQRISKIAYIIRTITVLAALAVALLTKVFNPIAAVIPMLMLRPIIMVEGILRQPR